MFYFYLKFIALPTHSLQKVFARQKATLFLVFLCYRPQRYKIFFIFAHVINRKYRKNKTYEQLLE